MAVSVGTKLGSFQVVSRLGAGGMGEVWCARDTSLDREVAIKILPDAMACDAERVLRFEREAKLLASLNHPNIAGVYGFTEANGSKFLVLEFVEGETLAQRLKRGRLSLDQTVKICTQIAVALEAAHDKGIIHRDLKPGNVMVRLDGTIKVLDFGLARAMANGPEDASTPSESPTITADFTRPGVILGTAAYMSPEQARGRPLDKRTDIWSFGVLLYECLTGESPFHGETVTDSIGAILHKEVDLENLPPHTPPMLRHVLQRCLERDKNLRLRDIGDARIELDPSISGQRSAIMPTRTAGPVRRSWGVTLMLALIVAVLASVVTWSLVKPARDSQARTVRLSMAFDQPLDRSGLAYRMPAISPDGMKIVYSAGAGGVTHLYVRNLDTFGTTPIPGTDGGRSPFFAPDGGRVGFFAQGMLKWVSLTGGAPMTVSVAPGLNCGGDWLRDGRIMFASNVEQHLLVARDTGGEATSFAIENLTCEPGDLRWPHALPDGKNILLTFSGTMDGIAGPHVVLVSLETRQAKRLLRGSDAKYFEPGYLIVGQEVEVLAAPFDLDTLAVTGPLRSCNFRAETDSFGALSAVVSRNGSLVYLPAASEFGGRLVWVERTGAATALSETLDAYLTPRLSKDNSRICYWRTGIAWNDNSGVFLFDIKRDHAVRLTLERSGSAYPLWTPDERAVVFLQFEQGGFSIRSVPSDGSGEEEVVLSGNRARLITSYAPDGETALMYEVNPITNRDIWLWSATDDPRVLLNTQFNERGGMISPNGKWFAFVSDQSGTDEVYVTSYPNAKGRWLVSTDGGTEPRWNPNGKELLYRVEDRMMAAPVYTDDVFRSDPPVELFRGTFMRDAFGNANYDIAADGKRFLMIQGEVSTQNALMVVLNWGAELDQLWASGN